MRTITSHWFSILWTMLVMAVSFLASHYTGDPLFVARAGALVTLAGILMTTRRLLVNSAKQQSIIGKQLASDDELSQLDPDDARREEDEHLKAEKCGFWFLIIGTLIWAYGDLIFLTILVWK